MSDDAGMGTGCNVQARLDLRKHALRREPSTPFQTSGVGDAGAIGKLKASRKTIIEQKDTVARMLHQCCDMCELITFEI